MINKILFILKPGRRLLISNVHDFWITEFTRMHRSYTFWFLVLWFFLVTTSLEIGKHLLGY